MGEEQRGLLYGERVWFHDVRTPVRRMAISTHLAEGIAVISFWQGDTCTGTFRLPLVDASRLIGALAEGMAEGLCRVQGRERQPPEPEPTWKAWVRRLRRTTRVASRDGLWVVR